MKARHLFMGALALLTLSCANTKEKGQQTSDADSTVVALFDNNVMQSSDDDYDDGVVGLSLPTPLDPGPLDYIPDAETDEVVFFTIANLGHYKNVESMRKGPFWKLLCSLYPDVENINKITVDNGTGDIWLIVPWGENTSLAINEYNMDMFLGEQDPSDGQVYYRTEYAKPMLIRTPMDDPGSIIINAVDRVLKVNENVYSGVHEVRQAADDALELHNVEKDLLQERRKAEEAYQEAVRQMKADVEKESKELKELLKEQAQG